MPTNIERKKYTIDASGKILGRLATQVAGLLRGKHKTTFAPNVDGGDIVHIEHVDQIKLTRGKETKKVYYHHSRYPGGLKTTRFDAAFAKNPGWVLRKAVVGMLPKSRIGRRMIQRLVIK